VSKVFPRVPKRDVRDRYEFESDAISISGSVNVPSVGGVDVSRSQLEVFRRQESQPCRFYV